MSTLSLPGRSLPGRQIRTVAVVGIALIALFAVLLPAGSASAAVDHADTVENITAIGNANSGYNRAISMSDDGNRIVFRSLADNLTTDAASDEHHVFLHDRAAGTTVNITAAATEEVRQATISGDGSTVVFSSFAPNLTSDPDTGFDNDVFTYDVASGITTRITPDTVPGQSGDTLAVNYDGTVIGFVGSANLAGTPSGYNKAFLWENGTFTKLSEGVNHNSYGVSISGDASLISFNAFFFGESQYYLWDAAAGQPVYQSPGGSMSISDDGSYALVRIRTNNGDRVALRDNTSGTPVWTTLATAEVLGYSISADGTQIALVTEANGARRILRYDTATLTPTLVLSPAHNTTGAIDINSDGSAISFISDSATLTNDPDNAVWDVFVISETVAAMCRGLAVTVNMNIGETPTANDDVILGTPGNDTILAGPGNDVVCAGMGDDVVYGSGGDDTIWGGAGNDLLRGHSGDDTLHGNGGDDDLRGGADEDQLVGGPGADFLAGQDGDDELQGSDDDDTVLGGNGDDLVRGGNGDDALNGGAGTDLCAGQAGTDTATGNCETVTTVP